MDSNPLRFVRNLGRSREIATVLLNFGFGDLVDRLQLRRYLQWGKSFFSRKKQTQDYSLTRGARIRMALESLGATFIKFGQVLSTRPDLVPADVLEELEQLQEHVKPFPSEKAIDIVQYELNAPIEERFAEFEHEPLAAGSLGQVHRAVLADGTVVAVKIRRPDVLRNVERDLSLMMELAILIEKHIPEAEVFDPVGLVQHFTRTIRRELNFAREGRTIDEFSRLFRHDATLYVPAVIHDLTTDAVLTMEFVDGARLDEVTRQKQIGITQKDLAANGARIFLKMAFEFGVFHGDPHPGNIRIMRDGSLCLLDYGMIGVLEDEQREQIVDLFVAVVKQDVNFAVEVIMELGTPFREIDLPLLKADVRDFIENYYGVPLERLKVGRMLTDFVNILINHGIRCPGDLMLLIRVFVTLEGVGRELDPHFNMAEHLKPFIRSIVRNRYSVTRMKQKLMSETKTFLEIAHDLPIHLNQSLKKISEDDVKVQLEHYSLDRLIEELDRAGNRVVISLVLSALIVASSLIIRSGAEALWLSVPIYILSSLLGIWLIIAVLRSGSL